MNRDVALRRDLLFTGLIQVLGVSGKNVTGDL